MKFESHPKMGPTTVFFKHLKNPKICMKPRFLMETFISKAGKKFFWHRMSMFWVSRSKFKHQTLRSIINYAHMTSRYNRNAWNLNHIRKWVLSPYFLSIWRTQKSAWNHVFWWRFLFQRLAKNFFASNEYVLGIEK